MLGDRSDYRRGALEREDLHADPIAQLRAWVEDAVSAGIDEPAAMCLATVGPEGPSARMVLMRGVDSNGIVFYTNYGSHKGEQLAANPACAATFWWPTLQRQVRIEGQAERVSGEESDAYFASRPRASQLASMASPQSRPIENRELIENRISELEAQFPHEVTRPDNWGGYRVRPRKFEFWQGRGARLHDRFVYTPRPEGEWTIQRLAP